jgi:hypothetical protein
MMMQTFAYEIGAAFLLAALLMGASFMRGFFSVEFLKNVKFAVIGLAVVLLGIAAYQMLPSEVTTGPQPAVGVAPQSPPAQSAKKAAATSQTFEIQRRVAAAKAEDEARTAAAPIEHIKAESIGAAESPDAAAATNDPSTPSQENRGKRWLKASGRAFHVGSKKDASPAQ